MAAMIRVLLKMGSLAVLLIVVLHHPARSQSHSIGLFDGHTDVGAAAASGRVTYDPAAQSYLVTGGGTLGGDHDAFHIVWRRMAGDFILRARAQWRGEGAHPDRTMGWIVRTRLTPDAPYVGAAIRGDGRAAMPFRRAMGDSTASVPSSVEGVDVIQLERRGDTFEMAVASFGDPFTRDRLADVPLGDSVYVGLFVSAQAEGVAETARFRNVRIIQPAPDDLVPYENYLGSNLETMDVESGHRTVVRRSPTSLQAPNWMPDGHTLIYNSEGLLYTFDLRTKTAEVLDTGFADENNNDHVLSFDGTQLGISHHPADQGGVSIIYTVPVEGGTPEQVTPTGPSYLHGWSPDGRFLVYTGERNGAFDIYKIPVEGGEEVRLTDADGLDDGSEYSPDGAFIYFNSVRSGSMEIWRMKPDGSDPEQLTNDRFNNWFPHVSPDGEKIVFLSYRSDIPPGDHPFYKQVYLRMMPVDGSAAPTVIAYVYGGQGTINVPSWSPDSRRIGFVSNTGGY